ncbi:MAG: tandem-95 repeat protein, partial [Planctomycetales bacterium]|nr:tandem-95 repeat protein [Planctomycetales bacterium]
TAQLLVTNDDVVGVVVNPTAGLITNESGGTATFTVVLRSQPTGDVTIDLASSRPTEGKVSKDALTYGATASLVFTSVNWNSSQTVYVKGQDDTVQDGKQYYTITTTARSGDTAYDGINVADVSVANEDDNDPPVSCTSCPAGLVAWWTGENTANDSVGGHSGTLKNGATFATGKVGSAFRLDGQNDYVEIPTSSDLDPITAATLDAWVYFDQLPSVAGHTMTIVGKSPNLDLQADQDNRFHFLLANSGFRVASIATIQVGQWYHVAGVFAANRLEIYVNGTLENTTSLPGVSRLTNANALTIGASAVSPGRYFNGLIDEVDLFNRALSASEIQSIYNAQSAGKCPISRTITVTTTDDVDDGNPNNGLWSLREAITFANATPGDDTINFAANVTGTINLSSALPPLSSNIDIRGPGANLLDVHRNAETQFTVFRVVPSANVQISGITISNGSVETISSIYPGGGILNAGTLTLDAVTIEKNVADLGGGIANFVDGVLIVRNSTISENNGLLSGGGIYHSGRSLSVISSTIDGNVSFGRGGIGTGGGILNDSRSNGGTFTLTNSTVTNNRSLAGAGIWSVGPAFLGNSIIARNPAIARQSDLLGTFTSLDFNLIGVRTDVTFNGVTTHHVVGDPLLGPLQYNGGPTKTRAPQPGSPALDAGNSGGVNRDQRDLTRIVDLPGSRYPNAGDGSDIGAVELASVANVPPTISQVLPQGTDEDVAIANIIFTVGDAETPAGALTVTATSSNQTLVPDTNITRGGSGASRFVSIQPAQNQSGVTTITLSVSDGTSSTTDTFVLTVHPVNDRPTVSVISNQIIDEDTSTADISFVINDVDTPIGDLRVAAFTFGTSAQLIPPSNITLGGSGANRTIRIRPADNRNGVATVYYGTNDGNLSSNLASFTITVNPVNDPPTLSDISDQTIDSGTSTGAISFTVGDIDNAVNSLVVTATSQNQTLVPNGSIVPGGSGATRTVTVTPAANQSGSTTITVFVTDGLVTVSDTFVLNVTNTIPSDRFEPNDGFATARDFGTVSQRTENDLTIHAANNEDFYRFTAALTGQATVNIAFNHGLGDVDLFVYDSAQTPIASSTGVGNSEQVTFAATMGQGYFVRVIGFAGAVNPDYDLNVNIVNHAPTISDIADLTINEDAPATVISFTVGDAETPAAALTVVSATSSNPFLVPDGNILRGGNGATRTVTVTPDSEQSGTTVITITVSDGVLTTTDSFVLTVNALNDPPTIGSILNQVTDEDTATAVISLTVGDVETSAGVLTVTATSSNQALIPNANILLGGSGENRTVIVNPLPNQFGAATITIMVRDTGLDDIAGNLGDATISRMFDVIVNAVNDPPTINDIDNQTIIEDTSTTAMAFIVGDLETAADSLILTAVSSDPVLVPNANIVFGGSGANRTVTVIPAPNQSGAATITVTVSDGVLPGSLSASDSFILTVEADNRIPPDRFESNDGFDAATDFGSMAHRVEYGLSIHAPNNDDFYRFTAFDNAVKSISVSFEHALGDVDLFVYDTNQSLLGYSSGVTNLEQIALTVTAGQSYFVRVLGYAGAVNPFYNLSIISPDRFESNDSFATVTDFGPLTQRVENTLSIHTPNNDDYFQFTAVGTGDATVGLQFNHGWGDVDLFVYDAAQNLVAISNGVTNTEQATFAVMTGQSYFVRVLGYAGAVNPIYDLTVISPDRFESNDAFGTATDFGFVTQRTENDLSIHAPSNEDYYRFTAASSGQATVSLSFNHSLGDVDLSAFDAAQTVLASSTGISNSEQVNFVAIAGQNYFIRVTGFAVALNPDYDLVVNVTNDPPTISDIGNQTTDEDITTVAIGFTVGDIGTPAENLTITARSSDPTLVPNGNLMLGGSGPIRSLTITPASNQSGTATITVTVSDGEASISDTFILTVTAANDGPSLSDIVDQTTNEDTAIGPLSFTIGDVETFPENLTVAAISLNQVLVPNGNLVFGGSGANRTLTVTPAANQWGTTAIRVAVSDGSIITFSKDFLLTVVPVNDAPTLVGPPSGLQVYVLSGGNADADTAVINVLSSAGHVATLGASTTVWDGTQANLADYDTVVLLNNYNWFESNMPSAGQTALAGFVQNGGGLVTGEWLVWNVYSAGKFAGLEPLLPAREIGFLGGTSTTYYIVTPEPIIDEGMAPVFSPVLNNLAGTESTLLAKSGATVFYASSQTGGAGLVGWDYVDGRVVSFSTLLSQVELDNVYYEHLFVNSVEWSASRQQPVFPSLTIDEDTATPLLPFIIGDVETAAGSLTVTASSSNIALVPNGNLSLQGNGANRTLTATPVENQSGTTTITVTVDDGVASTSDTFVLTVRAINDPPTISDIPDGNTTEDTTTGTIDFTVGDIETAVESLVVTVTSSNSGLVPDANLLLGGSGANRTLTVSPAANQSGTTTVTVTVSDGTTIRSDTFVLTVTAVNDAATISDIVDQSTNEETPTGAISFMVGDVETLAGSLLVTFLSSDTTLVPDSNLVLAGSGGNRTLTATPTTSRLGKATITVTVNDGTISNSDTFVLTVTAVNDPPVAVAENYTANEDSPLSVAVAQGVLVNDSDSNDTPPNVLSALKINDPSHGTLLLNADGSFTYTPAANYNGPDSFQYQVQDNGGTANGGVDTGNTVTVNLTVTAVNDAPVNSLPATAQFTNEDTAILFSSGLGNAISITDVDAGFSLIRVALTATNGTLSLGATSGLSFSAGDGTADSTIIVTGSSAAINAALDGTSFTPTANFNGTATLTITTNDQGNMGSGGPLSDTDTLNINVIAVNDAPVNSLPGTQSTNDEVPVTFSSARGNAITLNDLDAGNSTVRLTLFPISGSVQLPTQNGLTLVQGDGSAGIGYTFDGSLANLNAALNGLQFHPTTDFHGTSTLQVTMNDLGNGGSGGPLSDTGTINVLVSDVNDAPVNGVPGTQTVSGGGSVIFNTANGNLVSITDVDARGGSLRVVLTSTNGSLSLGSTSGLSFFAGDGTRNTAMSFLGTLVNLNNALNNLAFFPNAGFSGLASFTITTDDQGNGGTGGALSDTDTVFLTVTENSAPVLDNSGAPYLIAPAGSRVATEMQNGILITDLLVRGADGNPITDPDAGAVEGIALTGINKIDGAFGTWEYTLVANPQVSDWINVESAGSISNTSALLLPADATTRLRFVTTLLPRHNSQKSDGSPATPAQGFLPLETKLDTGITFRAWDRTTGAAGGRANTATNGGTTAFSTAIETAGTYFETRLFRSFNTAAQLNTYTLEQEFNALVNVFGYQDRSTSDYSGFTILMSPIPGKTTAPLYRMYFGIAFDSPSAGIQTDMGYRYLTTGLSEVNILESLGPAAHRAARDGFYYRELGVNGGTGITGYIYATAQPGTTEMFQIYRTDLSRKDTRTGPSGSPATGFVLQEQGDHAYTTKPTIEMTKTGTWRQESSRGFVRELSPNAGGATAPARSASAESALAQTSSPATPSTDGLPIIRLNSSQDRLATQFATPEVPFNRTNHLMNPAGSVLAGWGLTRSSRSWRDSPVAQSSNAGPIRVLSQIGPDLAPATDTVFARWQELVDSLP